MPEVIALYNGGTAQKLDDSGDLAADLADACCAAGLSIDTDAMLALHRSESKMRGLQAEAGEMSISDLTFGSHILLDCQKYPLPDGRTANRIVMVANLNGKSCLTIVVSVNDNMVYCATNDEANTVLKMLGVKLA